MKALLRTGESVVLIVTMLLLQAGCADTTQVRKIVEESNQAIIEAVNSRNSELVAAVGAAGTDAALAAIGGEDPGAGTDDVAVGQAWITQVDQIERYISEHPGQLRTNNALRIRQATVLMQVRQPNLAKAAFEQADGNQLFSERDRTLFELQDEFIWWYSTTDRLSSEERDQGNAALQELARVSDGLAPGSSTRRWLEFMRVRIGIRVARSLSNPPDIRAKLADATARYGEQFSEEEHKLIQAWHADAISKPDARLLSNLRWFDYVPRAFQQAETHWRDITGSPSAPPEFTPDWVACIDDDQMPCD